MNAPWTLAALYHLDTDPGETRNLDAAHPEIVRELKALLEASKSQGRSAARNSPP
jgi:arylsulfatase A